MFIDTSGWFSIFDSREIRHKTAFSLYESAPQRVTHSYVLAEFVALSDARKKYRPEMLRFLSDLLNDLEIDVIWIDETLTLSAVELLNQRRDKNWSLCDAVSFVIMESEGIAEALTTDHHFEQAGFVKLLDS